MIGITDNNYISEIARIGWVTVNSVNSVEVYVQTDDKSDTPHFHVRKYGEKGRYEWETCVKYTEAEYFLHGKYRDKLPDKSVAEELNKMLKSANPKDPGRTYWQTAIVTWNLNNSDIQLPFDLEQPDYTHLQNDCYNTARVIVAGGRDFNDYELLKTRLDSILANFENVEIVSGHARGADTLGEKYAKERGLPCKVFPADWKNFPIRAGFMRNTRMLEYAKEETALVIAFWDGVSHGTGDIIKKAGLKNIEVFIINYKTIPADGAEKE